MSYASRDRDYKGLEREIQNENYQSFFQKAKETEPFYGQFGNWGEVVSFMRSGTSEDPRKDLILRPIFQILQEEGDPRCHTILLLIFWPALESIHRKKRHCDSDLEERWQNVNCAFIETISSLNLQHRSDRLVQKIYNDTVHHLYKEYERSWKIQDREIKRDPETLEALSGGIEDIGFAIVELQDEQEAEIKRLQQYVDNGVINESDFYLLVGTRIYGKSLAECSREVGIDYEVAKKRRQRAEAAMRDHKKKS